MLRKNLLKYAEETHATALAQVGLMPVDTSEALGYCLDDAERVDGTNEAQKAELDRRIAILIHDRADMLGVDITEEQPAEDDGPMPLDTDEE